MNNGRQIEISRRIYGRLVGLYPREHRKEYGTEMERLFTTNTWRPWQPGPIGIAAAVAVHPGRSVYKRPQGTFCFSQFLARTSAGVAGQASAVEGSGAGAGTGPGGIYCTTGPVERERLVLQHEKLGGLRFPDPGRDHLDDHQEIPHLGFHSAGPGFLYLYFRGWMGRTVALPIFSPLYSAFEKMAPTR